MADKFDPQLPEWDSFTKEYHNEPYPFISPSRPEIKAAIAGKNVVVTGGGTGIGRAIAIAFSQAGAASVSILGRRIDRLEKAAAEMKAAAAALGHSPRIIIETADLMQRDQVDAAFASVSQKLGGPDKATLDILVSNAGSLPMPAPVVGYDADLLMRGFALNVLSAFNAIQAWVPFVKGKKDAVLLNISSSIAHISPMPGLSAYAASKAANLKMVDYVAAENPDIHVVNIQPGVVATEIMGEALSDFKGQDVRKFCLVCI